MAESEPGVDHTMHVRLPCFAEDGSITAHEEVPARGVGGDVVELLASPGFAVGCAAGDRVRLLPDGTVDIVARGPNHCVQVYATRPVDDALVDSLRVELAGVGDVKVEMLPNRRVVVITIARDADLATFEQVLNGLELRNGKLYWEYVDGSTDGRDA